ncbi:MAG TPA: hypothetical protein VK814_04130 [Acidobacteriaceae bacterium]|nr:hypothetical protein [Acidobacteriaceae bacterium]
MKTTRGLAVAAALAMACASALALKPGEVAPDFKGVDSNGKVQTLAQYRGKYVVLEWPTRAARSSRSITTAATWSVCSASGRLRAWCG